MIDQRSLVEHCTGDCITDRQDNTIGIGSLLITDAKDLVGNGRGQDFGGDGCIPPVRIGKLQAHTQRSGIVSEPQEIVAPTGNVVIEILDPDSVGRTGGKRNIIGDGHRRIQFNGISLTVKDLCGGGIGGRQGQVAIAVGTGTPAGIYSPIIRGLLIFHPSFGNCFRCRNSRFDIADSDPLIGAQCKPAGICCPCAHMVNERTFI